VHHSNTAVMLTTSPPLLAASVALFVAFSGVAAFDATYFHFRRFRLWAHPETRAEHAAHAARAMLMAPMLVLLFSPGRTALAGATVLVALDFVAAGIDVALERRSRVRFGGLPHGEYVVHLLATTFHVAALALAFAGRLGPGGDTAPSRGMVAVLSVLVVGSSVSAAQHLVLCCRGILQGRATARAT